MNGLGMTEFWWRYAACKGQQEIFFRGDWSHRGESRTGQEAHYDKARLICAGCVVRVECLERCLVEEHGGHNLRYGFFGGMTPKERDREARRRLRAAG